MRTAVRLAGYAAALAAVFAASFGVGAAVGPPEAHSHEAAAPQADPSADDVPQAADTPQNDDAGLAATRAGYTLVPLTTVLRPGATGEYAFAVTGPDGRPVPAYEDAQHEHQMHLIVVRRDAAGFQHLHPVLGPDGVWRTPLKLPAGGVYRVFADFVPTGGPPLVLGTDLFAPGDFTPISFVPSRVAQVGDYQVRLDGELVPGAVSQVFATVTKDGAPVADLEPHLGAFGYLVALRQSDLAYVHVHRDSGAPPAPTDRAGPGIAFTAEVPSAGTYRLFLDFRHRGVVRTAEFTVPTAGG